MIIAVIGGGPAGLRAAEVAAEGGASVTLFDAKPSVGRKFLVAGRGGLNMTKDEPLAVFAKGYSGPGTPPGFWQQVVGGFDNTALRAWAAGLGIETFAASTRRVYPTEMKAAPLLRRWVHRLKELGVSFAMNHRLIAIPPGDRVKLRFDTPMGDFQFEADAVILSLGGGSWPETGSDGRWTNLLTEAGIGVAPLQPANCGWEVAWTPEFLACAEGQPLKNVSVRAGSALARGELMITKYGLEGGALYAVGAAIRAMASPQVEIDLKPDTTKERLIAKLGPIRRNYVAEAIQRWNLQKPAAALLSLVAGDRHIGSAEDIASLAKALPISFTAPRPISEAISSAGGVKWEEIDHTLMLRKLPGIFVAGEMIDWEAPTGGYLMQGCFATGTRAAKAALQFRSGINPGPDQHIGSLNLSSPTRPPDY